MIIYEYIKLDVGKKDGDSSPFLLLRARTANVQLPDNMEKSKRFIHFWTISAVPSQSQSSLGMRKTNFRGRDMNRRSGSGHEGATDMPT